MKATQKRSQDCRHCRETPLKVSLRIDTERCKGCGLCVHVCTRGVLRMASRLNAKGFHYPEINSKAECTACLQCAILCPDLGIELERRGDE